ncbi:hypothetical protein [Candidatus Methanodesulfokora washburnensis]|uniref:hypothetical protein n=1 Tax=Candidatus Methanodesulfokora washburnensis TaxID=2478471 RepID=UPI0013871651|nr:hypothetical protein [Candidatus Methanodesulfokores washburnensis]
MEDLITEDYGKSYEVRYESGMNVIYYSAVRRIYVLGNDCKWIDKDGYHVN